MENWTTDILENCLSALIDYRGKTPNKTSFGVPLITAKIVKNGRIEKPNEFIAEKDYDSWMTRGLPKIGDVILTTEAPLGEVAQINDERIALAQRIILLRGKETYLNNSFLKYFLISDIGQSRLSSRQTGTTVLGIKQSELRKIKVTFPSFEEQKAIAEILSSLDDKIGLNQQMNATLEAMARAVFKAWFVDFEPVRANSENRSSESASPEIAKLFPSEFENDIPKGWVNGTLNDISFNYRQNVNPNEVESETAYVGLEHIPKKSLALTDWGKSEKAESTKSSFNTNDILFGKLRPYFHKVVIAPIDGICSTDILVIRPKKNHYFGQTLITYSSDEIIQYADRLSNGAKMPRTNWSDLANFEIVIPSEKISDEFSKFAVSITEKIKINTNENQNLTEIRNSLLLRLISGKIRVGEAENML